MIDRHYGPLDRLLHYVAFHSEPMQRTLADLEGSWFAHQLENIPVSRPVFIASLPRSGTTLLLELIASLTDFATNTYRDMPFVLCPLLWQRLTGILTRHVVVRERAHKDGMAIGVDSPESFEEIVWRAYSPNQGSTGGPLHWADEERCADFARIFLMHMRKVILLRRARGSAATRYVSKNNANVIRIEFIRTMIPDALIVVPFRNPQEHVTSLIGQHQQFLELQSRDSFARQYMRYVGHREFGGLITPIEFSSRKNEMTNTDPMTTIYWFDYWRAAFSYLFGKRDCGLIFLDYDELCSDPARSLAILADAIGADAAGLMDAGVGRIERWSGASGATLRISAPVENERLHGALRSVAINRRG